MSSTTAGLRLLNLSGAAPCKTGDGSAATFATLRALALAGHHIDYAFLRGPGTTIDQEFCREMEEGSESRLKLIPLGNPRIDQLYYRGRTALFHPVLTTRYAMALLRGDSPGRDVAMREAQLSLPLAPIVRRGIFDLLKRNRYDAIQVDYPWLVNLGRYLPANVPKLFAAHEIQTQIVGQISSDRRVIERMRRTEAERMKGYDGVVTLSPEDEEEVRNMGIANVFYSPLAIEHAARCVAMPPLHDPLTLTFLGGYAHPPNRDGVEWLCKEIVPAIAQRGAAFQVRIVGRFPAEFTSRFASERVLFCGFVDDLSAALAGSIFLCPIRIGSGMRIKILDAIACGAPVISTRLGARGLGLRDGESYLAAESPGEFAEKVVQLAQDSVLRATLVARSQEHLAMRFSPAAVAQRRTQVLQAIIAQHQTANLL